MKIYSSKRFISAIVFFTITLAATLAQFLNGFSFKLSILSLILFFLAIRDFRKSFSKVVVQEDLIEAADERNQLINASSNALSFKIILNTMISLKVLLLVLYGFLQEPLLIPAILTLAVLVTLSFICSIVSASYYDNRL